jgi:hypothetical protein
MLGLIDQAETGMLQVCSYSSRRGAASHARRISMTESQLQRIGELWTTAILSETDRSERKDGKRVL